MRKHAGTILQFKLHHTTCTLGVNIARDESPQTRSYSPLSVSFVMIVCKTVHSKTTFSRDKPAKPLNTNTGSTGWMQTNGHHNRIVITPTKFKRHCFDRQHFNLRRHKKEVSQSTNRGVRIKRSI